MKRCTLSACLTGLTLLASPAVAQINTTCSRIGQFTNCQTTDNRIPLRSPFDSYVAPAFNPGEAFQQGAAEAEARENARRKALAERQAELDHQLAESNRTHLDRRIGTLIADGDCQDAKSMALKSGRFDLVDRVTQYCVPTKP